MSEPADSEATGPEQERHASWAELFFDLVVVAGAATLAHVVAGHPDGCWATWEPSTGPRVPQPDSRLILSVMM